MQQENRPASCFSIKLKLVLFTFWQSGDKKKIEFSNTRNYIYLFISFIYIRYWGST